MKVFSRLVWPGITLSVIFLLAGCAGLPLGDFNLRVSDTDIERYLSDYFPLRRGIYPLADVSISDPRVKLRGAEEGRVSVGLDLAVGTGAGMTAKSWSGQIAVSGGIRYDPETRSIYVREPAVDELSMSGVNAAQRYMFASALNVIVATFYQERPIYRFSEDAFERRGHRFDLKGITVRDGEIVLQLTP